MVSFHHVSVLVLFTLIQSAWCFAFTLSSKLTEIDRRQLIQIVLFGPLAANANDAPPVTFAKDKFGSDLDAKKYLASKPPRDRSLVMGLKGEPTYLIINNERNLESFALNAECSHLGCIIPWSEFENKFVCPCHGSQYDALGNVLRGPAPHALALAHVNVAEDSGLIAMTPWTETDFRTNDKPWWK